MQQGNESDELAILQERAASNPGSLLDILALANAYTVRGQWHDALAAYKTAVELDSNNADLYNDIGTIYEELEDTERGKQAYLKAIELRADHSTAYFNLGSLYEEQGHIPEAIRAFEKCLEISLSKEERSEARKKIKTMLTHHADAIQLEDFGTEVVKLTADTITGQSRWAYYFAASMMVMVSIMNFVFFLLMGSFLGIITLFVDLASAVGLLQLRPGARHFTVFRAVVGAVLWPIITFASNDFVTAIVGSLGQWGYCGALILLLTGQSKTWRLILAIGIFAVFYLSISILSLILLVLIS